MYYLIATTEERRNKIKELIREIKDILSWKNDAILIEALTKLLNELKENSSVVEKESTTIKENFDKSSRKNKK